jgi:dihydroorotate dehydrogenase electron transfer subunit
MIQSVSTVAANEEIMPGTYMVWLRAPEIARLALPGQFAMVRCGNSFDPFLRRPLSIHRVDADGLIALLFKVVGAGTIWLSGLGRGDQVDILGPLGNGYSLISDAKRLLLIGGGIGVAPLLFLSDEAVAQGHSVVLLMGARTRTLLYPASLVAPSVTYLKATEDGSEGLAGKVTDIVSSYASQADWVCACGPSDMYRCMAVDPSLRAKPLQVSLEAVMGCGVGACYSCTVRTGAGLRQVCKDGPVFELSDILW